MEEFLLPWELGDIFFFFFFLVEVQAGHPP